MTEVVILLGVILQAEFGQSICDEGDDENLRKW